MFVGSMDCHTLQRVLASHSQLFLPSLTLKQLKQCAYRVYRLPSGEFRFFVRDTHGNKHGLQSNHFNAYRTDFLDSVKTALTKLCLSRLCSIRCTRALSQPSTADTLSLCPHSHTTNNLSSRTPSIAPVFSFQCSRPPPDHRGNTLVRTSTGVSSPLGFKICALSDFQ